MSDRLGTSPSCILGGTQPTNGEVCLVKFSHFYLSFSFQLFIPSCFLADFSFLLLLCSFNLLFHLSSYFYFFLCSIFFSILQLFLFFFPFSFCLRSFSVLGSLWFSYFFSNFLLMFIYSLVYFIFYSWICLLHPSLLKSILTFYWLFLLLFHVFLTYIIIY